MTGCVVCSKPLEVLDAHYANAWERSRKKSPCCSTECAEKFDPDVHWIPATLPKVVEGNEAIELRHMARQRLAALNEARPVVRELLIAGLSPDTLRYCIAESNAATESSKKEAVRRTVGGLIVGLLTRRVTVAESRDQRSPQSYANANADLDQWEAIVRARGADR